MAKRIYFDIVEETQDFLELFPKSQAEYIKNHETISFTIQQEEDDELIALACFSQNPYDSECAVLEEFIAEEALWDGVALVDFWEFCENNLKKANISQIYFRQTGSTINDIQLGLFLTKVCDFQYVDNDSAQFTFNFEQLKNSTFMRGSAIKLASNKNIKKYSEASPLGLRIYLSESVKHGFSLDGISAERNRSLVYETAHGITGAIRAAVVSDNTICIYDKYQLKANTDNMVLASLLCRVLVDAVKEFKEQTNVVMISLDHNTYEGIKKMMPDASEETIDEFIKIF